MAEYKTPGVYVEEISKFPPSVAGVATAIPAFIGVTENCPTKDPVRITSLLDFEVKFGHGLKLTVKEKETSANNGNQESGPKYTTKGKEFVLYDSIRLFYDNGGGVCYVASIGTYKDFEFSNPAWDTDYKTALDSLRNIDEVTLLLAPDAAMLLGTNLKDLQKQMLAQCEDLGDRFAILDLIEEESLQKTLSDFRDGVTDHLSFGAAYYPNLISSYTKDISFDEMLKIGSIATEATKIKEYNEYYAKPSFDISLEAWNKAQTNETKIEALTAMAKAEGIKENEKQKIEHEIAERNKYKFDENAIILLYDNKPMTLEDLFKGKEDDFALYNTLQGLIDANKKAMEGSNFSIKKGILQYGGKAITEENQVPKEELSKKEALQNTIDEINTLLKDSPFTIDKGELQYNSKPITFPVFTKEDEQIYEDILSEIEDIKKEVETRKALMAKAFAAQIPGYAEKLAELQAEACVIPPSGAIAGIYAANDNGKGVWQAPANVGIASISGLTQRLSDADQEDMNVDATTGKSVNAIRYFAGKGILVWGARTLDGNSNEWRYVPVRRLFNYIEESVQKSTAWAVFQPNDANTWVKIQCQIENFLNNLWRDGALAGSSPEKAFYVKVGQDITMTAADILAGYLIVEIGIAAVRPAEFIVLKFSHKLQEA